MTGRIDNVNTPIIQKIIDRLAVHMETEDTDRMVTIDTSRLIRLPDTIHGGSGLVAKHVTDLDRFDPLTDGARIRRHKHKDKHQGTCPRL